MIDLEFEQEPRDGGATLLLIGDIGRDQRVSDSDNSELGSFGNKNDWETKFRREKTYKCADLQRNKTTVSFVLSSVAS